MTAIALVIFDCDGTLVDSEIISAKVESEIFTDLGHPLEPAEIQARFAGLKLSRIIELLKEETGMVFPENIVERIENETMSRLGQEVKDIAGAHEILDMIDLPRCICSNSSTEWLKTELDHVGLWDRFRPYVYSASEVGTRRSKPAPDVFHYACKEFGVEPQAAVVLEDSVHGVAAAAAAGCRVVGFTGAAHTYSGHADALTEAGAETVINRLLDFPAVITALSGWSQD
ncbi:HAD family hydrolase [Consotaella salsifontis]|uniref:Haloacid dehalogenase superfamily, subfamily IA, variant 3 with third motif having DD or ED n=1 Tax=Consotaella salsifontis TaxID=1365950 RepID=A0A1T4MVP8_9HYPH|nr:HAD family phosphatase [Consotaella salsifontis]SJZ71190.1 haloacid dehalogenase superfamily, subfamily IA, variant 3 with third motif having DD or ED [Consotaella salsifontis]